MSDSVITKPLMGKEALIQRIENSYQAFLRQVQSLDEPAATKPVGEGDWTLKDVLAHIASWEDILVRFHIGGEPFAQVIAMEGAEYRSTTFDQINDHLHSRYSHLTLDEARDFLKRTHARVLEVLDSFPEDQLHQAHPQLSTGAYASLNWIDYIIANTYEHYEEHLATL